MQWTQKLTKKEWAHLKETQTGRPSKTALARNIRSAFQNGDRCFECLTIARKLWSEGMIEAIQKEENLEGIGL